MSIEQQPTDEAAKFDGAIETLNKRLDHLHLMLMESAGRIDYHKINQQVLASELENEEAQNRLLASQAKLLKTEIEQLKSDYHGYQGM